MYYCEVCNALPLPVEDLWHIDITSAPRISFFDGHKALVVDYTFETTMLSDYASVNESETLLTVVGGIATETLVFPVDPELIYQRTGYACMDETEVRQLVVLRISFLF